MVVVVPAVSVVAAVATVGVVVEHGLHVVVEVVAALLVFVEVLAAPPRSPSLRRATQVTLSVAVRTSAMSLPQSYARLARRIASLPSFKRTRAATRRQHAAKRKQGRTQ